MASNKKQQTFYFNCVVMGNEYLHPEETVATRLKKIFSLQTAPIPSNFASPAITITSPTSSPPNSPTKDNLTNNNNITTNLPNFSRMNTQFLVETTFAPKPFLLPVSTDQLHCALILFSPMRPLSFVRLDSFIDRLLHVPGLKIIILVVDADILGSDAAVASLHESSRCRPVSRTDLRKYVKLKRRILKKIDEHEEQVNRATFDTASGNKMGTFASTADSFFGGNGNDKNAKGLPPKKRELVVSIFQRKLFEESSAESTHDCYCSTSQLMIAIRWCFSKHFGDDVAKKIFKSCGQIIENRHEQEQLKDSMSSESSSSSSDENDDVEHEAKIEREIAKHEKAKREEEDEKDGIFFNDKSWPFEWEHQIQEARKFYRQQKLLFSRSQNFSINNNQDKSKSPSSSEPASHSLHHHHTKSWQGYFSPSTSEPWVVIPLHAVQEENNNHNNLKNNVTNGVLVSHQRQRHPESTSKSQDGNNYNVSPYRRVGSAALLTLGRSPQSAEGNKRPVDKNVNVANDIPCDEDGDVAHKQDLVFTERFAFWNPLTNQISLSVPKSIVADFQMKNFAANRNNENADLTASASSSLVSRALGDYLKNKDLSSSSSANNATNNHQQSYVSCPPHQAKKALIMAEKLREESLQAAEKKSIANLQQLQAKLTSLERQRDSFTQTIEGLKQKRIQFQAEVKTVQEKVYQVQRNTTKLKLANSAFPTASSPLDTAIANATEKLQILEQHSTDLSQWRKKQSEKYQKEMQQYADAGGRPELTRLYFAKFLENQQIREDLNKIKDQNEEIMAEIAVHRQEELQPILARRSAIEGRKHQLLHEIQNLVAEDMSREKNVNKFLDGIKANNQREREAEKLREFCGSKRPEVAEHHHRDDDDREKDYQRDMEELQSLSSFDDTADDDDDDDDENDENDDEPKQLSTRPNSKRFLFSKSISLLRIKLRQIQKTFRFDPVHLLRPVGLCRSPNLHQLIHRAQKISRQEYCADDKQKRQQKDISENQFFWIRDEFCTNVKQGLSNINRPPLASKLSTSIYPTPKEMKEILQDKFEKALMCLKIEELSKRQLVLSEESCVRMLEIHAAMLVHSRNQASKAIEFAKAKRRALFR